MSSEDIERRKRLALAVEGDDWSGVIEGQTKLTEEPKVEAAEMPTATIIRYIQVVRPRHERSTREFSSVRLCAVALLSVWGFRV